MVFFVSFWAICFEPQEVEIDMVMVNYHAYCDSLNECCKWCLFWFLSAGFALLTAVHGNSVLAEEKDPEECLWLKLCVWLTMNWFINMLFMVRNIHINTKAVTGSEVLYTLICFIIFIRKIRKLKKELRNSPSYKP